MVLPTIMTLKELCCFGSVEEVIRSTRDKKIPGNSDYVDPQGRSAG